MSIVFARVALRQNRNAFVAVLTQRAEECTPRRYGCRAAYSGKCVSELAQRDGPPSHGGAE